MQKHRSNLRLIFAGKMSRDSTGDAASEILGAALKL
jgi:hypothetical protein